MKVHSDDFRASRIRSIIRRVKEAGVEVVSTSRRFQRRDSRDTGCPCFGNLQVHGGAIIANRMELAWEDV